MDEFKAKQFTELGPGGYKCPCCNPYRGKVKGHIGKSNQLNKNARRKLNKDIKDSEMSLIDVYEEDSYINQQDN